MSCYLSSNSTRVRRGVLLINFGTPSNPSCPAVWSFLSQIFDEHLISLPRWLRRLCINGWIIPRRISVVAHNYRTIWTEEGSPLLVQSEQFAQNLATILLQDTAVAVGMQYGKPSIEEGIERLASFGIDELTVLPLYPLLVPQMAEVIQRRIDNKVRTWANPPKICILKNFGHESWYEQVLTSLLLDADPAKFDKVIFSFHALPEKASSIYREHCFWTAEAVAKAARLPREKISVGFQSQAGRRGWTEPSTRQVLVDLSANEVERVLVICPSFVVDCLENLHEVGAQYRSEFLRRGGVELAVVPALNQYEPWVKAASKYIQVTFSKGKTSEP